MEKYRVTVDYRTSRSYIVSAETPEDAAEKAADRAERKDDCLGVITCLPVVISSLNSPKGNGDD
jgi:hypothetical protein